MEAFPSGQPRLGIQKCIGKLVKGGKYLMPRVILKEVQDHLHEHFNIGTQGADKMLAILKAWVTDVNQNVTQHCVHCQANKLRNVARVDGYC